MLWVMLDGPSPEELARGSSDMTPEKVIEVQKYGRRPDLRCTPPSARMATSSSAT